MARDDSGSLIGEIVLNPERDETERMTRSEMEKEYLRTITLIVREGMCAHPLDH